MSDPRIQQLTQRFRQELRGSVASIMTPDGEAALPENDGESFSVPDTSARSPITIESRLGEAFRVERDAMLSAPASAPEPTEPEETGFRMPSVLRDAGEGLLNTIINIPRGVAGTAATTLTGAALLPSETRGARHERFFDQLRRVPEMDQQELDLLQGRIDTLEYADGGAQSQVQSVFDQIRGGTLDASEADFETLFANAPSFHQLAMIQNAQELNQWAEQTFAPRTGWEDHFTTQLGQGLGSAVAFLSSGLLPGGAAVRVTAGGATGVLAAKGEAIERALQEGATEQEVLQATALAAIPGMTEMVPLEYLIRMPVLRGAFLGALAEAAKQGLLEGGQEVVQEVMQNAIERMVYNGDQDLLEGAVTSAQVGGGVGVTLALMKQFVGGLLGVHLRSPTQVVMGGETVTIEPANSNESANPNERVSQSFDQVQSEASPAERVEQAFETVERATPPRSETVTTPNGSFSTDVQFEIVEAANLVEASGDLQPRDRGDRAGSDLQVQRIAENLDPARLASSTETDRGAPIVDGDGVVLSGNGRTAAIREAYARDSDQSQTYRDYIGELGFSTDGMIQPVLVRRTGALSQADRLLLARESNIDDKLAMSPSEQALADISLVTPDMLGMIDQDIDAGLAAMGNREFIRSFLASLTPEQQASFINADGDLTPTGTRRIEAALFARAYGSPDLVRRLIENEHDKSIRNALVGAAPEWARMRETTQGNDFDLTGNLVEAVRLVNQARGKGISLEALAAQADAFTNMDQIALQIGRLFYQKNGKRLARANLIRDRLVAYAQTVNRDGQAVGDMFADEAPTPGSVLGGIVDVSQTGQQSRLAARASNGETVLSLRRDETGMARPLNDESVALRDVIKKLDSALGLTAVRQGRLSVRAPGGKVLGQYSWDSGVIRVRNTMDVETLAHEAGHALHQRALNDLNPMMQNHSSELVPLAYDGVKPADQLMEGFAEWFRLFVTHPAVATSRAPQFEKAFLSWMDANDPGALAGIRDAQAAYTSYLQQPSGQTVAANLASTREPNLIERMIEAFNSGQFGNSAMAIADRFYAATLDKNAPIKRMVQDLVSTYEDRTGSALELRRADDPYVLARLSENAYQRGHADLMHGVHGYKEVESGTTSWRQALITAHGYEPGLSGKWNDAIVRDFGAYLVSRRAIQEYARYEAGQVPHPPTKETLGDHRFTVQEMEVRYPSFANAAGEMHNYLRGLLRKQYRAGLISPEAYQQLTVRQDYVPFLRDVSDKASGGRGAPRNNASNGLQRFKGSDRDILNPVETIMELTYRVNMQIARNDAVLSLDRLVGRVGPGAGALVERVPNIEMQAQQVRVTEVIRQAARQNGLAPEDAEMMIMAADEMFGEDTASLFRAREINERGEPIVYFWENGERKALRLADGEFGRDVMDALTGMTPQMGELAAELLAPTSAVFRAGITTHPTFILANYFRDQLQAWAFGEGYRPFIDGARGVAQELRQSDMSRIYNLSGAIMGGTEVAALNIARVEKDINALAAKGYAVQRVGRRGLRRRLQGILEITEITETGTRFGLMQATMERAKRDGLSDWEALIEAGYASTDYMDFGRAGSKMMIARRLVTFLNANLQGLDKLLRVVSGGDARRKLMKNWARTALKDQAAIPLTREEARELRIAKGAWLKMAGFAAFSTALMALYWDDEEFWEFSDYTRATHWMVKIDGTWLALPKPFQLAEIANILERTTEHVFRQDDTAMRRYREQFVQTSMPPTAVPGIQTAYELTLNRDAFLDRAIVPDYMRGLPPELQYTAWNSEFSKQVGSALGVSPAMMDHAIQGFGGSWGRSLLQWSNQALSSTRPDAISPLEPLAQRFVKDPQRSSRVPDDFYTTATNFEQGFRRYEHHVEAQNPSQAAQALARLRDGEQVYALLNEHHDVDAKRLHPMRRAADIARVVSGMRREMLNGDLENTQFDEAPAYVQSPAVERQISTVLSRIQHREMANAMTMVGERGYGPRALRDVEASFFELRAMAPNAADELLTRLRGARVYDIGSVRHSYGELQVRILDNGAEALLDDLSAGARDWIDHPF